jgi:hypothetical protein
MKAWEDLTNDRDITICTTQQYDWYMDRGLLIRRYNNGTFEIKNVVTNSDHYEDADPKVVEICRTKGWNDGMYTHNIILMDQKIDRIEDLMRVPKCTMESKERLTERKHEILKKISEYSLRIGK